MSGKTGRIDIVELNSDNLSDVNRSDSTFEVKARVVPRAENGKLGYSLEEIPGSYTKTYLSQELDYPSYIGNPGKTIFLAYIENHPAGQIILRRNWNRYGYIEDIRVAGRYRRARVGTKLMEAAIGWAKQGGMPGLMLETQDNNVPAVKLYESCGFKLGGFDRYLYKGVNPDSNEIALFWYLMF